MTKPAITLSNNSLMMSSFDVICSRAKVGLGNIGTVLGWFYHMASKHRIFWMVEEMKIDSRYKTQLGPRGLTEDCNETLVCPSSFLPPTYYIVYKWRKGRCWEDVAFWWPLKAVLSLHNRARVASSFARTEMKGKVI